MLILLSSIILLSIVIIYVIINNISKPKPTTTSLKLSPEVLAGLKPVEKFSNFNIKTFFPFNFNRELFQGSPPITIPSLNQYNCTQNQKLDENGCRLSLCKFNGKSELSIIYNNLTIPKNQFMFVYEMIYYVECIIKNYFQFIDYELLNTTVKNVMGLNINELQIFEKSCIFKVIYFFTADIIQKCRKNNSFKYFNMFFYLMMTSVYVPDTYTASYNIDDFNNRDILSVTVMDQTNTPPINMKMNKLGDHFNDYMNSDMSDANLKSFTCIINVSEMGGSCSSQQTIPAVTSDELKDINTLLQYLITYNLNKYSKQNTESSIPSIIQNLLIRYGIILNNICDGGMYAAFDGSLAQNRFVKTDNNISESDLFKRELTSYINIRLPKYMNIV